MIIVENKLMKLFFTNLRKVYPEKELQINEKILMDLIEIIEE